MISAQGEKQASVLRAQGDAVATVLRARASESMGERAIVDRGLESLERIGTSPSSTFVLPQELTSLLGRYGRGLTGSDVQESAGLESLEFDAETRKLLGLDDIDDIIAAVGDGESGEAVGDLDGRGEDATADVDLNLEGSYESTR